MKKILIIEDNADSAEILKMLLEFHGHTVMCAGSGRAGLALAKTFSPCVFIVDLGLPDMNGLDIIRTLAAGNGGRTCVIIVLTGWNDARTRTQAELKGVDHFFSKGDPLDDLLNLVNQ